MKDAIIRQVESLGIVVKTFRVNDTVEMHAVLLREPDVFHVARCNDRDGPAETYRCACFLYDNSATCIDHSLKI